MALWLIGQLWGTQPVGACLTWPVFNRLRHQAGVAMLCGVPDEATRAEGVRWFRRGKWWMTEPAAAWVTTPGCVATQYGHGPVAEDCLAL